MVSQDVIMKPDALKKAQLLKEKSERNKLKGPLMATHQALEDLKDKSRLR